MTKVIATPKVITDRLTFIDQSAQVKELKVENKRVETGLKGGEARTNYNAYFDQPATDVYNNTLGFRTVSVDEWLALPAYEANRPWEERFKEKSHLRGMLSNPLQTLGFALVDEDNNLICRLDGNGRAGAWVKGALEKPEFLHVLTMVLPKGMKQSSYLVSNTFDILNGDAQKVSAEHRAEIAKLRLIIAGEWVEFESNFVKGVKATAFNDVKKVLKKMTVVKPTPSDYIVNNKELVFLIDQLGIDTDEVKQKDLNCYASTVFSMMLDTLSPEAEDTTNSKQKKAFIFWQQWKEETTDPMVAKLWEHVKQADQSGPKVKKELREYITSVFKTWREENTIPQGFELPSFEAWEEQARKKAADELAAKSVKEEKEQQAEANYNAAMKDTVKEQLEAADKAMGVETHTQEVALDDLRKQYDAAIEASDFDTATDLEGVIQGMEAQMEQAADPAPDTVEPAQGE